MAISNFASNTQYSISRNFVVVKQVQLVYSPKLSIYHLDHNNLSFVYQTIAGKEGSKFKAGLLGLMARMIKPEIRLINKLVKL